MASIPFTPKTDRTGMRYGKLVVVEFSHRTDKVQHWKCQCDCGGTTTVRIYNLTSGNTKTCGCGKLINPKNATHGLSGTPTYNTWVSMKARCCDTTNRSYHRYGGRGITVCDRWMESFENFIADMGIKPPGLTLDRINNDGHYEPGNCRWATHRQQARNTSKNVLIEHDGQTLCVSEWSEKTGIARKSIMHRLRILGWSIHDALTIPVRKSRPRR